MATLAEFPVDPELVAAVEAAMARNTQFIGVPDAWKRATEESGRRRGKASNRPFKRKKLAERDGTECAYCGHVFDDVATATLDHVIPIQVLRGSPLWNLVLACTPCNEQKANRIPAVVMPLLSALVYRLAALHAAPAERGLVLKAGA